MTDEEKRMVELNNYIDDLNIDALIKFMNGESDDFEPIPTLKEVDDLNKDAVIKFMNGESDDFEPIPIPKEVDDDNRR